MIDAPATGAFTYTPDGDAVGYDTFTFRATDPTGASSTAVASMFIVAGSPRWPGQTVRANVANDGTEADGPSTLGASVSADGRFVAFASAATTLAPNIPPGSVNVYVRDRQTGEISLVSVADAGGPAIGGALPSISADGRYIVFAGLSTGLPGGNPNASSDIYLYDRQTRQTERVSVSTNGVAGNQESVFGMPSADGRYVVFYGSATNLVPGDTNGSEDVFVRDRLTGRTTRVSVGANGVQGNGGSWRPAMSADGRFIAFNSEATNLVPNDTNGAIDVFVRDVWTGQTTRVSVASDGTESNDSSQVTGMSADGRFIVMLSDASNLVADDTNGVTDVFVHDRQTGNHARQRRRRIGRAPSRATAPAQRGRSAQTAATSCSGRGRRTSCRTISTASLTSSCATGAPVRRSASTSPPTARRRTPQASATRTAAASALPSARTDGRLSSFRPRRTWCRAIRTASTMSSSSARFRCFRRSSACRRTADPQRRPDVRLSGHTVDRVDDRTLDHADPTRERLG